MGHFFYSEKHDLAVAQILKSGFQTIEEWLGQEFPLVTGDEARRASRRVAFFRHPIERLKSCYSFMYWMREYGSKDRHHAPVHAWEPFVDHILTHDNDHWEPQTQTVGDVPNIYHRFENIADHFETYRPGILPHNNRMTRRPTSDYRSEDLMRYYSADLAIWNSVQ